MSDEYDRSNSITYDLKTRDDQPDAPDVDVQQVSSTWEVSDRRKLFDWFDRKIGFQTNLSFQLRNVSFSARTGDLIMIIGSIASGKVSASFDQSSPLHPCVD